MPALMQFIAALATTLFAGAATYINLVEHPARMGLSTQLAASVWAPSYRRATVMQASLAVLGALAGVAAWALGGGAAWLLGALLIGAVVPVTLLVIMPTNHRLQAPGLDLASGQTRALLVRWGRLHGLRTGLSLLAAGVMLWQLAMPGPA